MKVVITFLSLLVLMSDPLPKVKVAGSLRKIMMQADFKAVAALDTLVAKKNIYGLGPSENLKGEIIIINSKVYRTFVEAQKLKNTEVPKTNAAMLVYTQVANWESVTIQKSVKTTKDLESILAELADDRSWKEAFPFQLYFTEGKIDQHIIDWKEGEVHTMDNHKKFARSIISENKKSTLLGFYSTKHQGVFTHHTSAVHIHALETSTKTVAHVDNLTITKPFVILLPKN